MLTTLLAFLVALGVLVTFHEFGHYWVARRLGVKVVRFSIGFGKPLVTWRRGETEWALAPIPLGGYVKMLDTREDVAVLPEERARAFDLQPVWHRIAIVAAGPVANMLLAVVLTWLTLLNGVEGIRPVIGMVAPDTPAAMAGLRAGQSVVSINGEAVEDWQQLRLQLVDGMTDRGSPLVVGVSDGGVERKVSIPPAQLANLDIERGIGPFGLSPLRLTTRLAYIEAGSAADRAGLRTEDTVLAVNGVALDGDWTRLVTAVLHSGGKPLALTVEHSGAAPRTVDVTPQRATPDGPWRLGIAPAPDADWMNGLQFRRDPGLLGGIGEAFTQTWQSVSLTTRMIGRMLTGDVSPASISGPITMADYAGKSARAGWEAFLDYMALISISLGVLNLLPIPLLDGGHLLYYAAEIIRGRPLSARAQEVGRRIGFSALAALMLFAFFNDITRLFAG